jgi:1-acyl-sn-glycerol-3-phosphate acyltransferase
VPAARRPAWPLRFLANLGALLFGVFGTILFSSTAIVCGLLPWRRAIMLWLSRGWARCLLAATGVRLQATYEATLDRRGRYVLLANHQSYYDIPALLPTVPVTVRLAAKKSLFKIPFFGWSLRVGGFIPIDREDKSKALGAFKEASGLLADGESVLFFPEGTRSRDGQLLPFERGGFLIALKSGLPIVPVGIRGAHAVQPRGRLAVQPGTIEVAYGTPIDPATYGIRRRDELMTDVRREIARLAGLADEAPAGL